MNNKQLDSYSLLIVSKYFETSQDFINVICVNSKFKETTEKLRYNPISVTSNKLFPKIQTQYLYEKNDLMIDNIQLHEIWYDVTYGQSLEFKNNNIKCHHIKYTQQDRRIHGNTIPNNVNMLDRNCYEELDIKTITIPNAITTLGNNCFLRCKYLSYIELSNSLKVLPSYCFDNCLLLTSIIIPSTIQILEIGCFWSCINLKSLAIPNSVTVIGGSCFRYCSSLQSITIPTTINKLNEQIFMNCSSLTNIVLPTTLTSIGFECFSYCTNLSIITLPTSLKTIGNLCFSHCPNLTIVNGINKKVLGRNCFYCCDKMNGNVKSKHNYQCC